MGDGDVISAIGTGEVELGNSFSAIGSAAGVLSRAILDTTSVEGRRVTL